MNSSSRFLIITGMSGAGKSQVMHALEDIGFFCVDNLPPALIPKFADLCALTTNSIQNIAVVVDSRGGEFFRNFNSILSELKLKGKNYELLFLEASNDALIRRYKETRRRHPMAKSGLLSEGIALERNSLECVRSQATIIIDTSNMLPATLRKKIVELYTRYGDTSGMSINIISFGFKYGLPIEADLVFDVRFLPNPYYEPELKKKTGNEQEVVDYISSFEITKNFQNRLVDFIDFLIPQYKKEGKSQLIIAIGCTGGMHRSVYLANYLEESCKKHECVTMAIHRDIDKKK
ncbi:RNase adapter RapZ [Succinispira mobilis]|uniref:RNase adapter RapZ n=1 Tax=Succinispira mobilis TaxID=78120 RepID=UPI00037FAC7A|nr:RNase adapter RapZ [Succinispira mobilis]